MKILGTTFLAICPILFGLLKSKNLKQNQIKIEKIIELINRIITEIRFAKTNTYKIFKNLSLEENFSCLEFLQYFKKSCNLKPFPKAFKESINNWECSLKKDDLNKLKALANVLGSTDSEGQILALNQAKKRFEESLKSAKKIYDSKGKISRSLGILLGIAIFVIFI